MGDKTKIQWTDATWNPLRGCSRVSEGCRNCYAETVAARFSGPGQPYEGLATRGPARWTGKVRLVEEHLGDPLRWRKPRLVFVNSMSDLFHESVPDEWIDRVFAVMALAPRHTFQVLTKRPERMRAYLSGRTRAACHPEWHGLGAAFEATTRPWPLPNVWLGVSVEDQATADERIPLLLHTPAAVRFISAEPLLGPVCFSHPERLDPDWCRVDSLTGRQTDMGRRCLDVPSLDWVIVGGESGHGARPMDVAWIRSIRDQCAAAEVPVFVKQLGARPRETQGDTANVPLWHGDQLHSPQLSGYGNPSGVRDRKGGDPSEWPEDLRVRQMLGVAP